jgi:hypothetical protein
MLQKLLTPSSYGLQQWKSLIVENKDFRAKLKPVSWNQRQAYIAMGFLLETTALLEIDSGAMFPSLLFLVLVS